MSLTAAADPARQTVSRTAWSVFFACLLASVCLLTALGHRPLADWDEAIYAGISREMLSGHVLAPTWHFQSFLEKPPLYMWLTAALFHLFGVNEFTARVVSALSAIAVVGIIHGVVARLRGLPAAWLATVVLLTMRGFLRAGRVGELDMLLTLGCCISLWGISRIRSARLSGWYLFWIGFAVAVMTKSAAGVVIPATLLVHLFRERWPPSSFRKEFFAGAALFLALAAPWHLYMWHHYGAAFWHEYLGVQVLSRSTKQLDSHNNPPWFYLGVLSDYAAPWLLLLPFAVVRGMQKKPLREFMVFAVVVLGLFSAASTRLPQYIVPIYPALAVIAADCIHGWVAESRPEQRARRLRFAVVLAVLGLIASQSFGRKTTELLLHRSTPSPGEQDDRWLVPLLRTAPAPPAADPILLCIDGDVMPLPAAAFYTGRHLQQVYIRERADTSHSAHRYYVDPQPLADFVDSSPRLMVIDKATANALPATMAFQKIREEGSLEMGTITLQPGNSTPQN
jgi:4-amino-4-deoxy-L-arabinose transferase-like glycosyltransferase